MVRCALNRLARSVASLGVIVTDSPPCGFPDMLLRIEVGRCGRKCHQLQARIGRLHITAAIRVPDPTAAQSAPLGSAPAVFPDSWPSFRRSSAPPVAPAPGRFSDPAHRKSGSWCGWDRCGQAAAARVAPTAMVRGLQIQRGFIHRYDHRLGCVLRDVNQFFSICASKSATAASLRDLKTWAGRWYVICLKRFVNIPISKAAKTKGDLSPQRYKFSSCNANKLCHGLDAGALRAAQSSKRLAPRHGASASPGKRRSCCHESAQEFFYGFSKSLAAGRLFALHLLKRMSALDEGTLIALCSIARRWCAKMP